MFKNIFTTLRITLSAFIALAIGLGIWISRSQTSPENELVVGMLTGYPPFYMVNTQGTAEGFDVDVAQEIANTMNKKLKIVTMNTAENIIALEQGKIDLLISGLCITKTRCKKFDFVHYLGEKRTTAPLAFWKEIPANVKSLADLIKLYPEAQLIVEPGSSWDEFILDQYPTINAQYNPSYLDMILELKKGSSTMKAALFDPDIVAEFVAKFPDLKIIEIPLNDFAIPGMGIALKKGNKELLVNVENIIGTIKKTGTLKALETKWFKNV